MLKHALAAASLVGLGLLAPLAMSAQAAAADAVDRKVASVSPGYPCHYTPFGYHCHGNPFAGTYWHPGHYGHWHPHHHHYPHHHHR
ncbi:hypothetical protein Misp01_42200 [Microtetraspora sp. NBRC 13810]|uniref:hypothetical protein n=1 Tax=Microtetraspora sp. NBRC 13810 TaxID=3030990 RepID=UPI0024A600A8|nr:hypothetical protein [Microtetraspora sp. NBRC 13810]GLW09091.1 hypothetical protein Misp01_42200 [Microtetraspora sp. NBRC 13810]